MPDQPTTSASDDGPPQSLTPISLVDDDVVLRRSLQLLLHAAHYDVRAYASAEALLADPRSHTIACLISDMHMPGMDGFTLFRKMRAGGWTGQAILITSSRGPKIASLAAQEGFHAVLIKPFADRIVLEAVKGAVALIKDARSEIVT